MGGTETEPHYTLRTHRTGDMGWITYRHGVLYNAEHGWGERFEALVAEVTVDFIKNLDTSCERCWIADREGEFLGCVMLVKDRSADQNTAKIRLLLVEPSARGLGLGRVLVKQCVQFAREAGYSRVVLWTQSTLTAARRIYKSEGFELVKAEEHDTFGIKMLGELWELAF
ncbi:hypothetical protein N7468_003815 [Penicillium chermesinum]|uniref:N-acetyltransferase domain-containing protein n=1 Tax=Penicillium chermesinum TaxID=63820 RepID=A0A9W9TRZ2_9EURO|nr:uncharacterized protein N7468_003815 [Penicillium chermesinum]KAJ5239196.1 hypothetical protein N7468_003815 [Penicillium chermesinum]KAJ6164828.1 hypothetical protein N7470_003500 [Penicillium chermesinum]